MTISHTTTLKTLDIKSKEAIEAAVAYLCSDPLNRKIELQYNTTPRMYNSEKTREVGKCDIVLKLPGSYDVGFKLNEKGTYDVFFDSYQGYVNSVLGNKTVRGVSRITGGGEDIELLLNAYGVAAAQIELESEYGEGVSCSIGYSATDDSMTLQAELAAYGKAGY